MSLCNLSFDQIFLGKIPQANKNPLYFLLQKSFLSKIGSIDPHILIHARFVSIASALLICVMLLIFIYVRLGLLIAVFAVVSLASQYIFYQYAAENRPYMLWLLLFTWLVIATFKMCLQSYEKSSLGNRVFFGVSIFVITLTISFGIIQSTIALLTCLFFWYFIHDRPKDLKLLTNFIFPIFVLCILTQGYYTLQSISALSSQFDQTSTVGSNWDVISQMKKGDMSLLKMPARLLLPKPSRDAYFGAYLSNLFVLLGMGIPFLWWNNRKNLGSKDFFVFVLSAVTLVQAALVTFIVAFVVIFFRYFFVQRLFLYLIICHAFLAAAGLYYVFRLNKKILNPLTKGILVILFCLSLNWHWQYYSTMNNAYSSKYCITLENHLDGVWQKLDNDWRKNSGAKGSYVDEYFDYIVKRTRHLEICAWDVDSHAQKTSFCSALRGEFPPVYFRSRK